MDFFPTGSMVYKNLDNYAKRIETLMGADVLAYFGPIDPQFKMLFIDEVERLANKKRHQKLLFCCT